MVTLGHNYLSTACWHGKHDQCRKECKFCKAPCKCECHDKKDAAAHEAIKRLRD
jgi:hypothetical protein